MIIIKFFSALFAATGVRASPPLVSSRNLSNDEVVERIGTYKMLAVRVTTSFGQEPQESLNEIEGSVFGTGKNAVMNSVVRQFDAVSHGQLRYIPAVTNGAVEIKIGNEIRYYLDSEQEMINATEALFDGTPLTMVADRILFCLPDNTLGDGVWGLAQFPGRLSYFHYGGCKKLALLMHELGHNLGFDHSGIAGDEYDDRSCYMGGSKGQRLNNIFKILCNFFFGNDDRMVLKAYNGHKQWVSGWFDDKKLAIDLSKTNMSISMRLACFVDSDFSDDYALLRLDETLFIQYNCGKGYNIDSEVPNTVTITRAAGEMEVSERVASLVNGRSYEFLADSNEDWSIKVCSIHRGDIDYADISVHRVTEQHQCAGGSIRKENFWAFVAGSILLAATVLATAFGLHYFGRISLCYICRKGNTTSPNLRPTITHPGITHGERMKKFWMESTC